MLFEPRLYPKGGGPLLSGLALRMAHALVAARAEMDKHTDWHSCASAPFNTIVLPPENDNTIPVYFLTPQTENGRFPFGGHYEVDVGADGQVVSARPFTRACITLTKGDEKPDSKPVAMAITHILDPRPTEVHVFEQVSLGVPLYVGIVDPRSTWKVESGQIAPVDSATGE